MPAPENPRFLYLAPIVFVAHVAEESPGFVEWFNSLVEPDITQASFISVNAVAFVITTILVVASAVSKTEAAAMLMLAWLSLLMFANALLHLTATVVHGTYSPGLVTALALYLPYFAAYVVRLRRQYATNRGWIAVVTILGALPMAAHGYLIIFRGSRLF